MPALLANRLIAFLDVLGFSEKLASGNLTELHQSYSAFIDEARTRTFFQSEGDNTGRTNFVFSQFLFDSIVLVSHDIADVYNVNNFVSAVSLLLELGFTRSLPLRGAIAQGNFLFDDPRNIFLSEIFPELLRSEKNQEWSGCQIIGAATATIENAVFGTTGLPTEQIRNLLVHRFDVPTKFGTSSSLVLNYLIFLTEREIKSGLDYLIEPKRSGTRSYFDFLLSLPLQVSTLGDDMRPAKFMVPVTTRSGFRLFFLDEGGNRCVPEKTSFTLTAVGRWRD